jgi:hypothetical protein
VRIFIYFSFLHFAFLYLSLILDDESTRGGRACQPVKSLLVHNNVTHENCNRYKPGTGSLRGGFIKGTSFGVWASGLRGGGVGLARGGWSGFFLICVG